MRLNTGKAGTEMKPFDRTDSSVIERVEEIANLFGSFDENIRLLEQELGVQVTNRDGALKVAGEAENVMLGVKAIEGAAGAVRQGGADQRAERALCASAGAQRQRGASSASWPGM